MLSPSQLKDVSFDAMDLLLQGRGTLVRVSWRGANLGNPRRLVLTGDTDPA
jgi:hypothetical protein